VICPGCSEDAKFVGYRRCRPTSLFGKIVYERAYYHCRHCKRGWFPTDAEFGIEAHQTLGAREVISLLGVLEPFAPSARRILPRLTGLSISASTVQRTTESVGEDVAQRRAAGETFGADEAWKWNIDAVGRRVAYVGLSRHGRSAAGAAGRKAGVPHAVGGTGVQPAACRRETSATDLGDPLCGGVDVAG